MPSRFAAVTNKEISQLIKQAVSEIHEGDEFRFGSFNRQNFIFLLEFIDKTCEKVFCLPNANGGVHAHSCIMGIQGKITGN